MAARAFGRAHFFVGRALPVPQAASERFSVSPVLRTAALATSRALFGLVCQALSLAADELTLKLRKFLRLFGAHQPICEVESIRERFFRSRYGTLPELRRMAIDAVHGDSRGLYIPLKSNSAPIEIFLCEAPHPVHAGRCHLGGLFYASLCHF